jgi:hypothetical protein
MLWHRQAGVKVTIVDLPHFLTEIKKLLKQENALFTTTAKLISFALRGSSQFQNHKLSCRRESFVH